MTIVVDQNNLKFNVLLAPLRLSVFEARFKVNGTNKTRLLMNGTKLLVNGSRQSVTGTRLLMDRRRTVENGYMYLVNGNRN